MALNIKIDDIDTLVEDITLSVFNTGTKPTNFRIIKALPTDVDTIMKETGLTKVPVNKHLNELEKFGLLRRSKGTGKVYPTELTGLFISLITEIEKQVSANASQMIAKMVK